MENLNTNSKFQPATLLYPIEDKDYTSIFINEQWDKTKQYLEKALIITVFGYSAPKTDQGALSLLEGGYGASLRYLDEIEIIDKYKNKEELYQTWKYFHGRSHGHLNVYQEFSESSISKYPRRSVEVRLKQNNGWWNKPELSLKTSYNSFKELETDFEKTINNE